jgi:hypothetical protein
MAPDHPIQRHLTLTLKNPKFMGRSLHSPAPYNVVILNAVKDPRISSLLSFPQRIEYSHHQPGAPYLNFEMWALRKRPTHYLSTFKLI